VATASPGLSSLAIKKSEDSPLSNFSSQATTSSTGNMLIAAITNHFDSLSAAQAIVITDLLKVHHLDIWHPVCSWSLYNGGFMKNSSLNFENKWFQVSMLVCFSFLALSGCGARSTPNDSTSLASTSATASTKPSAKCNQASKDDVQFQLMAYTDQNNNTNNSLVRLKFINVPSDYVAQGYDIQIRKWTASSTGVVSPSNAEAPQYVNTRFDYKSNGVYNVASNWNYNLSCSTCPALFWSNMLLIAKARGETYTDANTFFSNYTLLLDLNDAAGDWKALQVNFVNSSGVAVRSVNALIPTFDANPADYQANHPAILTALHPFYNMLNQGWTASQFQTQSNSYCF
jgi:hypothetical protein